LKIPNLTNITRVARWEFLKNVKSPIFLVLTFVIPLIMVAVGGISYLTEQSAQEEGLNLAVVDQTSEFYRYLEDHTEGSPVVIETIEAESDDFERLLQEEPYEAILEIEEDSLQRGALTLYTEDARGLNIGNLRGVINNAASSYRVEKMGLDPQEIEIATAPVELETRTVTGEEEDFADMVVPFIAGMALIFAVILTGQILMYGVIKEKRNRVVEILLSSISSLELLLGKIAGFGALSLAQIGIWLGAGLVVALTLIEIPVVNLGAGQVVIPILFFFFGFLMLFSIFAAVGATMKEAEGGSQAQGMIIIIPMIPLFLATPLIMNPNALWARIISHIPPFTPTAVLIRMGGTNLPAWEIASTLAVLILATVLFVYLGAKIFEGTILQYDRSAGWKDLKMLFRK